ncbi:MAG: metallophosphoesterase family protein [Bacteroidota bacterium]
MRKIAISDIHGCAITFKALVEDRLQLTKTDELFLLGDYVDRGPNSKGVFDYIFQLQNDGYTVRCLRGNHENMMLDARSGSPADFDHWRDNGGDSTLASFGILFDLNKIPEKYWQFCETLPYYFELDQHLLVHAGFNFLHPRGPLKDEDSMVWIRNWYEDLDREWLGNRIIIHGHTPRNRRQIEAWPMTQSEIPILNIDCGCFFTGQMCAYDMSNDRLYFQENLDMSTEEYWY